MQSNYNPTSEGSLHSKRTICTPVSTQTTPRPEYRDRLLITPWPLFSSQKEFQTSVQLALAMTTAVTTTSSGSVAGENTGRWTAEEHRLFLQGLEQHGKGWKKIASLIKSRTVVQIRTHAQKYFQKLSKARQNGEEGEISMDSRGGPSALAVGLTTLGVPTGKRRRLTTGTKRKAISSVVASAHREGKKMVASQEAAGVPCPIPHLPVIAPALAPFIINTTQTAGSGTTTPISMPAMSTTYGALSGPALEDSLYVFLHEKFILHTFLINNRLVSQQVPFLNTCPSSV